MKLPLKVRQWMLHWLVERTVDRRPPDITIGDDPDRPYLRRWWIIPRNPYFNVYFHHFCRSDDPRGLHDHPWWNASIILKGRYMEEVPADPADPSGPRRVLHRPEGSILFRLSGKLSHRVLLYPKELWTEFAKPLLLMEEQDVWTLFITGPKLREWGFWCPGGRWVHWQKFTKPTGGGKSGAIGAGCGED